MIDWKSRRRRRFEKQGKILSHAKTAEGEGGDEEGRMTMPDSKLCVATSDVLRF